MKKILIATTVLASMATVAAAETGVKIGGYGRFGLVHYSGTTAGFNETTVHTRLRLNIDATTETDSGVVFGGRIRMQDSNYGGAILGAAQLYTEYEGLRVEVGNTNTAWDSAALIYDSEMGLRDTSGGDSRSAFFGYDDLDGNADRMGVYASYAINGFSAQASFVTPDQYSSTGVNEELGLALAYSTDLFTVSAAAVQDGAGIANNDMWFIGGAYKATPELTVGLNYIDEGIDGAAVSLGKTAVLYGNYTMGATTLKAYVANNDYVNNATDTSFGIGADYDLGGAKLTGSIQRDYAKETYADLGVRFNF